MCLIAENDDWHLRTPVKEIVLLIESQSFELEWMNHVHPFHFTFHFNFNFHFNTHQNVIWVTNSTGHLDLGLRRFQILKLLENGKDVHVFRKVNLAWAGIVNFSRKLGALRMYVHDVATVLCMKHEFIFFYICKMRNELAWQSMDQDSTKNTSLLHSVL